MPTGDICECDICNATFPTKLKYHKRMFHQRSVAVKYPIPGEEKGIDLLRDKAGHFQCLYCPFRNNDPCVIQNHAKMCTECETEEKVPSTKQNPDDREALETPTSSPENVMGPPLQPLPPISNSDYQREPDPFTILTYSGKPLLPYGFVVNTILSSFICVTCFGVVSPDCLSTHLKKHQKLNPVPEALVDDLKREFSISQDGITWPTKAVEPIYPIPLIDKPLQFCSYCSKGYTKDASLLQHQQARCPHRSKGARSHMGYAQAIQNGHAKRYIEVDISTLAPKKALDYAEVFMSQPPSTLDHSLYPISGPEDDMSLNSFFAQDGWLKHVEGMLPADLVEARRTCQKEDSTGGLLRSIALRYLQKIQPLIQENITYGIIRAVGSVSESDSSKHMFRRIQSTSVQDYSLVLHRLIFNCVRFYGGCWESAYQYPDIDKSQQHAINALRIAVADKLSQDALCKTDEDLLAVELKCLPKLDMLFHKLCLKLFAHAKYQYEASRKASKFFSPVICFIIIHCIDEKGGVKSTGAITGVISAIMYSIRSTVIFEVEEICKETAIDKREALKPFTMYLQDQYETPMSFAYNATVLLGSIRGNEMNDAAFTFTDASCREVSRGGALISLTNIKKMIEGTLTQYNELVQKVAFFGEETPTSIFPPVDISKLLDNQQNRSPGYSFIDDPRNCFDQYRQSYGKWFLSDRERAERFVHWDGQTLVWKPQPTQQFLKDMEQCRALLAVGTTLSAGPSARSTEVSRRTLRNVPGVPRSLRILYHNVALVDTEDKTSRKSNKDLFVPHVPTREWSTALIQNIALFRPFEEYLVEQLFPTQPIITSRYRYQLWPGLKESMTGEHLSDCIGRVTKEYLGDTLKIRLWRELVTTFSSQFDDARLFELHKEYYVDAATMHSTTASVNKYGGHSLGVRGVDSRMIVGCIKVGIEWHKLVGVGQAKPLSVSRDEEEEEEGEGAGGRSRVSATKGAEFGELSGRSISGIAHALVDKLLPIIQDRTVDTINDAIAECSRMYFPKAPVSLDSATLRPVSDVSVHPSRLKDLRKFLRDPKAQFTTPEQGVLLEHALAGRDNVLGILGTAFGKTTLIMMMAKMYAQARVTVVVLPLSALHDDLDRRAKAHGLHISRWSPQEFNPNVNIITVAVEYLAHPQFRSFLSELYLHNSLFQLVFDEIHKIITDANFRDVFRQFWTLKLVQTPILGLTASLPDKLMPAFQNLTGLSWKVIRMSSNRKEMVYGIITVPKDVPLPVRIAHYLKAKLRDYEPADRALIFCRTTAAADEMATQLSVKSFHSKSIDTNPATMHAWRSGNSVVMVSTSILGCGLDYPSIRDVLHMDLAHSMLDMYQEDSRGGRDGRSCCALTFIPEQRKKPTVKEVYPIGTEEVYQWATQKDQCLRIIPSLFLDGVATTCTLLKDAQLCLVCAAQINRSPPPKPVLLPTRPSLHSALLMSNQPSDYLQNAPMSLAPMPPNPPHTPAFAAPVPKGAEQQRIPPITPFFPPAHTRQATATPSTLYSHPSADFTHFNPPYASAFVTPMQKRAEQQNGPTTTPFFASTHMRQESATPSTLYSRVPTEFMPSSSSTPVGYELPEYTAPNIMASRPPKRSLPDHEQYFTEYPRAEDGHSALHKSDLVEYPSSKRARFSAKSFTGEDLAEMLGPVSPDERRTPPRSSTSFAFTARTSTVTPQNQTAKYTPQQASSSTYQIPYTPATPTPDQASFRNNAGISFKSKAGVGVRQEHQDASDRSKMEWEREVVVPLRAVLDAFRGRCISCYFKRDSKWTQHATDSCSSGVMSSYDSPFVEFRTKLKMPPGHCFGCTLNQKRGDHAPTSGMACPDTGIIVRLCYGYRLAEGDQVPLHPQLSPSFIDSDDFVPWLLQPHIEQYENYWLDPKKVRYNVWLFVIWLAKELNIT